MKLRLGLATLLVSICMPTFAQPEWIGSWGASPLPPTPGVFETETRIQERAFLSGVDVRTDAAAGVVVTLGDSITDGVGSRSGANNRWPDIFSSDHRACACRWPDCLWRYDRAI